MEQAGGSLRGSAGSQGASGKRQSPEARGSGGHGKKKGKGGDGGNGPSQPAVPPGLRGLRAAAAVLPAKREAPTPQRLRMPQGVPPNARQLYFWPAMAADIKMWCQKCDSCQRVKAERRAGVPWCLVMTDTGTMMACVHTRERIVVEARHPAAHGLPLSEPKPTPHMSKPPCSGAPRDVPSGIPSPM